MFDIYRFSRLELLSSVPASILTRPLLGGVGGGTAAIGRLLMLPPTSGNPTLESAIRTVFLAGSAGGGGDGEWLSPEGGRGRGRGGFRRDC